MKLFRFAVAMAMAVCVCPAHAEENYPARPVRLEVAQAAGGVPDVLARIVAKELAKQFGQPVIVENRGGAAGAIAAEYVARSPADGYTLLVGSAGIMTIAPHLVPITGTPLPYKRDEFTPIALMASLPNVFVVAAESPVKSMADLVATARKKPGMSYGSLGTGSTGQISTEMLARAANVKLTQVPYRGESPALADVLGGHVPFMAAGVPTVVSQAKSGALRALAVTSATRSALLPDVPTMEQLGYQDFEMVQWYGLYAPSRTPPDIVAKIDGAVRKALQDPSVISQIHALGMETATAAQRDFAAFNDAQDKKWGAFVSSLLPDAK